MNTTRRSVRPARMVAGVICHHAAMVTLAVGLAFGASAAVAQNLLTNGSFDHDTSGWPLYYPEDPAQREIHYLSNQGSTLPGGSGPGAIEVFDFDTAHYNHGYSSVAYQDVAVTAGHSYWCAGTMFRPSIHNVAVRMAVLVEWLDSQHSSLGLSWLNPPSTQTDQWVRAETSMLAPAGAQIASVRLTVGVPDDTSATDPALIYYDDLAFQDLSGTTATQALFVPGAASAHGVGGTFWTTTGWFASELAVPVDLYGGFLWQHQGNGAAVEGAVYIGTIPPHGFLALDDLVAATGGAGNTGGLYLLALAQGVGLPSELVTATTYTFTPNPVGAGAYGQGVPAVPAGTKNRVIVPGVFQDAAHRTNIGVLNTSDETIDLDIAVYGPAGETLGIAQWQIRPYEQSQAPVTALGVGQAVGGYVVITRTTSVGSFRAYASVVDQATGDAAYAAGS